MAEHSAVNRRVVVSSPTWGAKLCSHLSSERCEPFVLCGILSTSAAQKNAGKGMAKGAGSCTNVNRKRPARYLVQRRQKITLPALAHSPYKWNQKSRFRNGNCGGGFWLPFSDGLRFAASFLRKRRRGVTVILCKKLFQRLLQNARHVDVQVIGTENHPRG